MSRRGRLRPYVVRAAVRVDGVFVCRVLGTYSSEAAAWRAVDARANGRPGLYISVYYCGRALARPA